MLTEYGNPVKYTKCTTNTVVYDTGLKEWINLDSFYKDECIRDKVICKVDVTYYWKKYFSEEFIKEYRLVLMNIAKGLITDAKLFSGLMTEFIKMDSVFAQAIRDLFNSCPEDTVFGYYIIQCLADTLSSAEADYRNFFRGKPQVVICLSNGYIYFSVSDVNQEHSLPIELDCEVISYGKNWRGNFKTNG